MTGSRRFSSARFSLACGLTALAIDACSGGLGNEGRNSDNGDNGNVGTQGGGFGGASGARAGGVGGSAGASGQAGGSGVGGSGGVMQTAPMPPFAWVGVIGTGQSLSVGARGEKVVSTTQPFQNRKLLDAGPAPAYPLDGHGAQYSLVPLTEPFRTQVTGSGPGYTDGQYPNNIAGESPNAGMANEISALWKARASGPYVTLHSVVGWSGHPLVDIDKQGNNGVVGRAYPASLAEAKAFKHLADEAGKTFGYGAVVLTHGESDAGNPAYGMGLVTFLDDYNHDLKAITGQTRDVVLLVSQQSVSEAEGSSAVQVWRAGVDNPGKIVCTGPKYQYQYADDNIHFQAPGYLRLGEKYAEVFDEVVNKGNPWKPLQPSSATLMGKVITVTFDVPVPPLSWDDKLPMPHQAAHTAWAQGRGLEVRDDTGELTIASVAITGPATVTVTLGAAPSGKIRLGYALTQDGNNLQGGQPGGPHGQLRDSDELVGYDDEEIACEAVQGSTSLKSVAPGGFANRDGRDVVSGAGVPSGTALSQKISDDEVALAAPWSGASGATKLRMHHDLHNYCVHFSLPVP